MSEPEALEPWPGTGRELLCLACLGETITGDRRSVAVAITLAPMLWPPGRADGVPVAVPACWQHVQQAAAAAMRAPLEVKGRTPRPRGRG